VPVETGRHISTVRFDRPLDVESVRYSGSLIFETRSNDREGIVLVICRRNAGLLVGLHAEAEDEGDRVRAGQELRRWRRERQSGRNGSDG
jgi:hypothetical protein